MFYLLIIEPTFNKTKKPVKSNSQALTIFKFYYFSLNPNIIATQPLFTSSAFFPDG